MKEYDFLSKYLNKNNILLANKILSDKRFYGNPNFMKYSRDIFWAVGTEEKAQVADKILSDEKLYSNPDVMKHAGDIISAVWTDEEAQTANKILSNECFFNNPDFMNVTGDIIKHANYPNIFDKASNLIDRYLNDDNLLFLHTSDKNIMLLASLLHDITEETGN